MTRFRLIANAIVGVILAVILAGLVILVVVESAERGARHGRATEAEIQQNVPYPGGGRK